MGSYRFFDHTGDFGVELEAEGEAELYEASVEALLSLMLARPDAVEPRESRRVEARGIDPQDQLVALGNEVLFLFETGWLPRCVEVEALRGDALVAVARGEPFDAARHEVARPVKAVTHHGARVEERADGRWVGRLVFDL